MPVIATGTHRLDPVAAMRSSGEEATATYTTPSGEEETIDLVMEDGDWKVRGFSVEPQA